MAKLTWAELEDFIRNIDTEKLDHPVFVCDMKTFKQTYCDVVEIKEDNEWTPFIGINLEETEN